MEISSRPKDVFISHSHFDDPLAEDLCARLQKDGLTTLRDGKNGHCRKPFELEIANGIANAGQILCLVSKNWIETAWGQLEQYSAGVRNSSDYLRKLFPVILSERECLPSFMRPLECIDCSAPNSLDKCYPQIRDRIRRARLRNLAATQNVSLSFCPDDGSLRPLSNIFVLGHPGAGKSTFSRVVKECFVENGVEVREQSDYPFLQALFRLDILRGDDERFEPHAASEFRIKNTAVLDEALELILSEPESQSIRIIELARRQYGRSFLRSTLATLPNSAIVYVDAGLAKCRSRNEFRRAVLESNLAGERESDNVFDLDPDVHYVLPAIYDENELQPLHEQELVLRLLPSRGYFRIKNAADDLEEYRAKCRKLAREQLLPLIQLSEKVADFHQRRLNSLREYSTDGTDQ